MTFKKGQSGNPSGRPKEAHDIKLLARAHGPEAIAKLKEWMHSDNAKASVQAANILLDRGYGKSTQPLSGDETMPPIRTINMADKEIIERYQQKGKP